MREARSAVSNDFYVGILEWAGNLSLIGVDKTLLLTKTFTVGFIKSFSFITPARKLKMPGRFELRPYSCDPQLPQKFFSMLAPLSAL